ncbi:MAG: hypothetical protein H0T92_23065 [Pyrinomonadaceae bacterium]|nr:hypothetical protein [Pyrinomonadaceae bacterium]
MSHLRYFLASNEAHIRRTLMLCALYAIPVHQAMHRAVVADADVWWHLRTGKWIVEHGAVPTIDSFSAYGMGKPWVAYSWLFEALIYSLYKLFGLVGLSIYTVGLWLAIAFALHTLIRKLEPNFVIAVVLTACGLSALAPFTTPRPWLFTILFFILEINILWTARQSGDVRRLFLLPPLFVLWANIHIQFVYGLFVLGLVVLEPALDRLLRRFSFPGEWRTIPARPSWLVLAACVIATFINPYHLKIYQVVFETISQTGMFRYISELQALGFRQFADWLVLLLTLGATFALAWRREIRPLPILLLLSGTFLSFRASRDAWFVVVVALTIIAASLSAVATNESSRYVLSRLQVLAVALVVGGLLLVVGRIQNISDAGLRSAVTEVFPEAAVRVVEERSYTGPIYNHFDWGGYLIWRLPSLPVAMDGRSNIHGDERTERSIATWNGKPEWESDPELTSANLVIADVNLPLASLLRLDLRFELVYEDKVAVVFVSRLQPPGQ